MRNEVIQCTASVGRPGLFVADYSQLDICRGVGSESAFLKSSHNQLSSGMPPEPAWVPSRSLSRAGSAWSARSVHVASRPHSLSCSDGLFPHSHPRSSRSLHWRVTPHTDHLSLRLATGSIVVPKAPSLFDFWVQGITWSRQSLHRDQLWVL